MEDSLHDRGWLGGHELSRWIKVVYRWGVEEAETKNQRRRN